MADRKYGNHEWESRWAKLEGDGELKWGPDPELTARGVDQAKEVHNAIVNFGDSLPRPTAYYASPLTRALDTLHIEWHHLLQDARPVQVYEECRETIGKNTCDKRSPRSEIQLRYPNVALNITEADELWTSEREQQDEMRKRVYSALSRIWNDAQHDRGGLCFR